MNFGSKGTRNELVKITSRKVRRKTGFLSGLFNLSILALCCVVVLVASLSLGVYRGIIDTAPNIEDLKFSPTGVATTILDSDGNVVQTLIKSGSNRELVEYDEIPKNLIDAFVAIEDERFWEHRGIDLRGILRAGYRAILSGFRETEGASTITQQLLKNAVFDGGAESSMGEMIVRKLQEQHLAVQLENTMDKTIILQHYLNTINLGSNTLGVQSAAQRYFGKDVSDLTLSECAVIAAITQNPYYWNPITHPENNAERRETILDKMEEQGKITASEKQEALADDVYTRIAEVNSSVVETSKVYSYFTDTIIEVLMEDLQKKAGYSEVDAYNLLYSGGLTIQTTLDSDIQAIVDEEINDINNYINQDYHGAPGNTLLKYAIDSYQLSVTRADGTTEHFMKGHVKLWYQSEAVAGPDADFFFDSQEDAKACIEAYKKDLLNEGDVVIGENLNILIQPQTSFVLMDQNTGYVLAISGGRGEKTHSLSLNRATDTLRQPGSTFKILADYAPALDISGATLATTEYDAPYSVNGKQINNYWASSYVWPDGYIGYATFRQGIEYSMNVIAAKSFMTLVSPSLGYQYLLNFGISSLVENRVTEDGKVYSDLTPTLCLGGITDGVSNLELTAAYAAIANNGIYTEPIFYTRVLDRNGKIIIDNTPESHTVLKESTAFLLTDAMKDSIDIEPLFNTAIISGSYVCAIPDMSVAGKSGTTSDNNDAWFVGYTPYYTAGIWMGYDNNGSVTGASVSRLIWQKIMARIHNGLEDIGFGDAPEGVTTALVCKKSGKLAIEGVCDQDPRCISNPNCVMVYEEYFAKDTAPTEYCDCHIALKFCAESGEELLAGENCDEEHLITKVYMVIRDKDKLPVEDLDPSDDPTADSSDSNNSNGSDSDETPEATTEAPPVNLPPQFIEDDIRNPEILTADEKYTVPDEVRENQCTCGEIEESTEDSTEDFTEDTDETSEKTTEEAGE